MNRSMDLLEGDDDAESEGGSSRDRGFVKKSSKGGNGKNSGMKARWNAPRTPGEEAHHLMASQQVDEHNSIMGGGEVLNDGDVEMTSFETRSGLK